MTRWPRNTSNWRKYLHSFTTFTARILKSKSTFPKARSVPKRRTSRVIRKFKGRMRKINLISRQWLCWKATSGKLFANLRYLIDCELPDIIEEASKWCQEINKSYHSQGQSKPQGDISILISKFLNATRRQVVKHREIGNEILSLRKDFVER